ncbi:MAG: TolC family protein, partial [Bacteroidota bacterium]
MKHFFLSILFMGVLAATPIFAQNTLSLEEAINTALQNSYGVKIARNSEAISNNLNTYGNAGFLPRATVDASAGYTNSNTAQRFFSGDEQMGRGVGNTNARASI